MRLLITTPTSIVIDAPDIAALRAEDESGGFGILPGHTDFLTALTVSVVSWRDTEGRQKYCAVRHGVLTVTKGREIAIATRQAVPGDDLDQLEQVILAQFREKIQAEKSARTSSLQLQLKAMREIIHFLRPGQPGILGNGT